MTRVIEKIIFLISRNKKTTIILSGALVLFLASWFFLAFAGENKRQIGIKTLSLANRFSVFLPISADEKKELETVDFLVRTFTEKNDREWTFLFLLQNNMELRPGGGFLGQYAVLKIKNGEVTYSFFEDANLLDQKIQTKVTPPYPFARMMQIKKWKFRDSNFSPDFPQNVEKAKYFYRLAGKNPSFDGVIAVNADVLAHVLKLTGPIQVPGYPEVFTEENVVLKLEEKVEKAYLMNPELDTQNRKAIMKKMTPLLIEKLASLKNIPRLAQLVHEELQSKNIMVNFSDPKLQEVVRSVHWTGEMAREWSGDYLMMADANMGALKSDYYMRREIEYDIDLTGEKPLVNLTVLYKNTAPGGDWRTSDYHTYVRFYVPKGANLLERKMVSYPNVGEEFEKTYFGFICHVLMRGQTKVELKYELPADFPRENYRLLIQKQSGVGEVPVKVKVRTEKGEFEQEQIMKSDLKFEFQEKEEKKS